jgi:hypothetical protein
VTGCICWLGGAVFDAGSGLRLVGWVQGFGGIDVILFSS